MLNLQKQPSGGSALKQQGSGALNTIRKQASFDPHVLGGYSSAVGKQVSGLRQGSSLRQGSNLRVGSTVGKAPPRHTPADYRQKAVQAMHTDPTDSKGGKSQRRRGISFREEYRAYKNGTAVRRGRAPSMIHEPTKEFIVPPQRRDDRGKYTIVLDLDETLIYARDGPLYARPHLELLFDLLDEHCEAIAWTAGVKAYAQTILKTIDTKGIIEHCVYRHKKWFSAKAGYQKDLLQLGRDMDRVLIIENTPDCIRGNPANGILVSDYLGDGTVDPTIPALTYFIASLVDSGKTVPEFLASTELLARTSVLTDVHDFFDVYTLNCGQWSAAAFGNSRVNRDLMTVNVEPVEESNDVEMADANVNSQAEAVVPMRSGIPLHVPISPGGTYHQQWAHNDQFLCVS